MDIHNLDYNLVREIDRKIRFPCYNNEQQYLLFTASWIFQSTVNLLGSLFIKLNVTWYRGEYFTVRILLISFYFLKTKIQTYTLIMYCLIKREKKCNIFFSYPISNLVRSTSNLTQCLIFITKNHFG